MNLQIHFLHSSKSLWNILEVIKQKILVTNLACIQNNKCTHAQKRNFCVSLELVSFSFPYICANLFLI